MGAECHDNGVGRQCPARSPVRATCSGRLPGTLPGLSDGRISRQDRARTGLVRESRGNWPGPHSAAWCCPRNSMMTGHSLPALDLSQTPIGPVRDAEFCKGLALGQPALAPFVVFCVAETLAAFAADAEIEFLDVLVLAQGLGLAVEHHPAGFQDIAIGGEIER